MLNGLSSTVFLTFSSVALCTRYCANRVSLLSTSMAKCIRRSLLARIALMLSAWRRLSSEVRYRWLTVPGPDRSGNPRGCGHPPLGHRLSHSLLALSTLDSKSTFLVFSGSQSNQQVALVGPRGSKSRKPASSPRPSSNLVHSNFYPLYSRFTSYSSLLCSAVSDRRL